MVLRLSHAPKIGAALAFGLIATGIAVSQSQTWDQQVSPLVAPASEAELDAGDLIGPPMPATPEGELSVNLADAENPSFDADGEAPEIALHLLTRGKAGEAVLEVPSTVATVEQVPEIVRMIDMPRRGDELDELGRPIVAPDQFQVAALPSPNVARATDEEPVAAVENLIAPIPAPAYRRPIESYLISDPEPVAPGRPVSRDPLVPGNENIFQSDFQDGTWPRRLDQVVSVQGQPHVVNSISTDNLFLSDWVEVQRGGGRRVIAR